MSNQEQTIEFLKNFLFEMAVRIAALEKVLLDKKIISDEELNEAENKINTEAQNILNDK